MTGWPVHDDPKLRGELAAAVSRLLAQFAQRPYRPDAAQDLLAEVALSCVTTLSECVGEIATRQALESDLRQLASRSGRYWPRDPELAGPEGGFDGGRRSAQALIGDELRYHPRGAPSRKAVAWALLRVTLSRAFEEIGPEGAARIVRALLAHEVLKLKDRRGAA